MTQPVATLSTTPPPHSVAMERAVLSGLLLSASAIPAVRLLIQPADLYVQAHRLILEAIIDTYYAEGAIDYTLVRECLVGRGQWDRIGGDLYLSGLLAEVGTAINVERHARIVLENSLARQGIIAAADLSSALYAGEGIPALTTARERLRALCEMEVDDSDEQATAREVVAAAAREYEARRQLAASGRTFAGLDTGFSDLSDRLNGLCPGDLTVLGADTSVGKTTLAVQILHTVITAGHAAAYVTQEEPPHQVGLRLEAVDAWAIDPDAHRKGRLDPEAMNRIEESRQRLAALDWWCYGRCRTIDQIERQMRGGRRHRPVALWVIDHLHRTRCPGAESRHLELSAIVNRLKDLALELDTSILLLSQLSRAKDRPDRRPRIDDLRESGAIEESADNVVLIYRPGRYDHLRAAAARKGDAELVDLMAEAYAMCEKCRRGAVGGVKLVWRNDVALFGEPVYRTM